MSKVSEKSLLEKAIQKEFGNVFLDIDQFEQSAGTIIPTTLKLDLVLGGGWQDGTVGMLAGVSGSGKTTLALTIAANAQKMGKKIYWCDAESRLQKSLLTTIKGLSLEKDKWQLIGSSPEKFLTAEDYLNIITMIVNDESNAMIIIDSIASLCPENLHSAKLGESKQMATAATLMYAVLRKITPVLRVKNHILLGITHTQANPTGYGGPNEVGGNAWKFFSSYRLTCLSSQEIPNDKTEKTGRVSEFKVFKSALGPGTGKAQFPIRYHHGYDYFSDLVGVAEELCLIEKAGAWYSAQLPSGEVKIQGLPKFATHLEENPKDAQFLDEQIRSLSLAKKR